MGFVFRRGVAIPLWTIALGVLALGWLPSRLPTVTAVILIAASAWMLVRGRRLVTRPATFPVVPAALRTFSADIGLSIAAVGLQARTLETATQRLPSASGDELDLVRMDDDGGWRLPSEPSASALAETRRSRNRGSP